MHPAADLLSACEREPIHLPGRIQGHGALLALSLDDLSIQQVSATVGPLFGIDPTSLLGAQLPAALVLLDEAKVASCLAQLQPGPAWRRVRWESAPGELLDMHAHAHGGALILELEPASPQGEIEAMRFDEALQASVAALQPGKGLSVLCETVVEEIARLTGFDRVMVYRFDEVWNGAVVAERIAPGVGSYLGQHFPASDIPAQARQLFLCNWIRTIADVDAPAAPLGPAGAPPLDLGRAILRSASPVHLEYLRNMGVAASMTASLVRDGRLWGLVACHHRTPKRLSARLRNACALLAQITSAALGAAEEAEESGYRGRLRATREQLVKAMADSDDLVSGLVGGPPNVLDLAGAEGSGAAINLAGEWQLVGNTPPLLAIEKLIAWLHETRPEFDVFATHELPRLYPEAQPWKEVASGLLAISLPKTQVNGILWFRPEVEQTVSWAGNPEKPALPGDGTLHPRTSFALWKEVVRETSLRWKPAEIEAAAELRRAIIACDLRRQFRKEQAARMARDHVLGVVSHDLRNPLGAIQMSAESLDRKLRTASPELVATTEASLRRIGNACRRMRSLIEDVLNVSRIEAGTFAVAPTPITVGALLWETFDMLEPLAGARSVALSISCPDEEARVLVDRERVLQVFSNLVGNAIKFTPPKGSVRVAVETPPDGVATFSVRDDGPGISGEDLPHVFDSFWQASRTGKEGAGLGLAIARGIVEAHGGKIWADSTFGAGATFSFTLPRAR